MNLQAMNCWKCGHREIETIERIGFRDALSRNATGRSTYAAIARFYDPAYNNQCRETMAERVVDKERSNFCEYFAPAAGLAGAAASMPAQARPSPERDARAQLDALFKKKKP